METKFENWTTRPHPLEDSRHRQLEGQYCRLELLNSETHELIIQQLYDAFKLTEETHFFYLGYGPFKTIDELKEFIKLQGQPVSNTVLYSIIVNNIAIGFISFLRINQQNGTIGIGHVNFSSQLVRTRPATKAHYLLLKHAFDVLGYRRVGGKCNALNVKSRQAASRLGYQYEGTWLKDEVSKSRSRDTSWFSMLDDEWLEIKKEFERWLSPDNFDINGQQLTRLKAGQVNSRTKETVYHGGDSLY